MRSRKSELRTRSRPYLVAVFAIACAGVHVLGIADSLAQPVREVDPLRDLGFGVIPAGSQVTLPPTAPGAGAFRLRPRDPCGTRDSEITFSVLPSALTSGGGSIPLTYGPTSARVTQEAAPNAFRDFDPRTTVFVPQSWFPVIVTLGATASPPSNLPSGTYTASPITISYRYFGREPGQSGRCMERSRNGNIAASATVQAALDVAATNGPINLGVVFPGTTITIPANNSGAFPAAMFSARGPSSLNWRLNVSANGLRHGTAPDVLPLAFTTGLYGRVSPPATVFATGAIVTGAVHQGGPLLIWLGYSVTVPPVVTPGIYSGSLTLTVEAILN